MREIKLRAWDFGLKKMTYSGLHAISFNGKLYYGNADMSDYKVDIMQYTGLKDANGKEIYEGDIVRIFNTNISVVTYKNGTFGYYVDDNFIPFGGNYNFGWINSQSNKIEIVGNIYENPELIERRD